MELFLKGSLRMEDLMILLMHLISSIMTLKCLDLGDMAGLMGGVSKRRERRS
jgi:hypothetical protein